MKTNLLEKIEARLPQKMATVVQEIRENEQDPEKMKLREYVSFACGHLYHGSIRHMIEGYRPAFYMSTGMDADRAGLLSSLQILYDSVSDPLVATFIDTRRATPYRRFTPFLPKLVPVLATFSIVMFTAPSFLEQPMAMLAWLFMTYAVWETVFTFSNVSFDAIGTVMSGDLRERTLYTTIGNIGRQASGMVPGFIPVALEILTRAPEGEAAIMSETNFFTLAAAVFAIIGGIAGLQTKHLKERLTSPPKEGSVISRIIQNFRLFFRNKHLLLLWSCEIPHVISRAAAPASLQFYVHSMQNAAMQSLQWTIAGIPQFLAHSLAPFFLKRYRPSRIIIACTMANGISLLIMFVIGRIVGYTGWMGIANVMIFASIGWVPSGIAGIAMRMLQLNTFDYVAAKTGQRAEATSLMMFNMMSKWLWALAALLGGFALAYVGFQSGAAEQTQATRDGLFAIFALLPAVGNLLGPLPLFFYKLEGKEFDIRMAELGAVQQEKQAIEIE